MAEFSVANKESEEKLGLVVEEIRGIMKKHGVAGNFFLFDDFIGVQAAYFKAPFSLLDAIDGKIELRINEETDFDGNKELQAKAVAYTISMLGAFGDMMSREATIMNEVRKFVCNSLKINSEVHKFDKNPLTEAKQLNKVLPVGNTLH